jgi:hypothetical protein
MSIKFFKKIALSMMLVSWFSSSNAQIQNVLVSVLGNPGNSLPGSVNIKVLSGFVPVLPVLYHEPLSLPSYISSGGVFLSPGLPVPPLPLVNQSLLLPGVSELDPIGAILPTESLNPSLLVSDILGIFPAGIEVLSGL